jgi:hypothetical protein
MAWRLKGRSAELCSCKMLCPCWLGPGAEPDQGWCSGAFVFDISEGHSDGIDLSGCKTAVAFDWPGDFWAGQGTARLYVDAAASDEQRPELEAIFSGQRGGLLHDVLSQVVSKVLPTEVTPFSFDWGESPSLRVGSVGEARLQPLKDQSGKRTTLQGAAAMGAFQLASLDVASSKGSRWSDPDLRTWEGDSGTLHEFDWSA